MLIKKLGSLVALAVFASTASAQFMVFSHSSSGSGSIGGVPFTSASFEITAVGNTNNISSSFGIVTLDHEFATIDIAGVGVFDFVVPTRTFINQGAQIVGFSRSVTEFTDLVNGPNDPAYATWDMTTSMPAATGFGALLQWSSPPVDTTGGVLIFDNANPDVTFSADLGGQVGSPYCPGDGSGAFCPCAGFGGPGEGCLNTGGTGATMNGSGTGNSLTDFFAFDIAGVPGDKPGLILRGDNQVANPAGDGILCTAGNSQRSHVQVTVAGATVFDNFNGGSFQSVSNIGTPTNFQFWYRDPANTCSGAGFNFSNAWTVTFTP